MPQSSSLLALASLVLLSACRDPNDDPSTDGGLSWEPCPLFVEGHQGVGAQCATVERPLRAADPEGQTLELFVQRRLGRAETHDHQLWMLPGGPGQSAAVYESYVRDLDGRLPEADFYLFEHRGVGRSTRLSCPDQEADDSEEGVDISDAEWPDCLAEVQAEWGDDLDAFSIDEAAHDLAWLIEALRGDAQVTVYGGSYGTTLAHRLLQHHPGVADAVVLDSVAVDVDHRVYDQEFDEVGATFMELCAEDERCAEALGPDPHGRALEVLSLVEAGHCAAVIDAPTLRAGAAAFLADASLRGFAPSLFHRVGRCAEDDQEELDRLISLFTRAEPHPIERLYSPVLFAHIELSEQWPEPWPELDELEAAVEGTAFSFALGPAQRPLLDTWPRYPLDPVAGQELQTDTPVLILQGGLDPQTPAWRVEALADRLTGAGQHTVWFPEGTHILLGATPGRGGDCATQLLLDFVEAPWTRPDDACVETVAPVDFTGQPLVSQLLFTDCSRYGNGCGGRQAGLVGPLLVVVGWGRRRRGHGERGPGAAPR